MRRLFIVALTLSLFVIAACKKAEEKQQADAGKPGVAKSDQTFRPQARKRQPQAQVQLPPASLKIFNESNLVTDIPPAQYSSLATSKIKIGAKQHSAILLKDLLAKYNVKGKSVIVEGEEVSTPLTWEQATGQDVYMYVTPKKFLKVFSASLTNKKFPKRVDKITVKST